jgi:hypothetical protein
VTRDIPFGLFLGSLVGLVIAIAFIGGRHYERQQRASLVVTCTEGCVEQPVMLPPIEPAPLRIELSDSYSGMLAVGRVEHSATSTRALQDGDGSYISLDRDGYVRARCMP